MPKVVDHDARRHEILQATWRVISSKGLDAATVREIAREAGVSNGVLAHYFSSKDDILVQAHRLAFSRVTERVNGRTDGLAGLALLRVMLFESLPLDEERYLEAVIDVNFLSRSLSDPALKAIRAQSGRETRAWWASTLSRLQAEGDLSRSINVELLTDEILVFIDGVSLQAVHFPEQMTTGLQEALATALLQRIDPSKNLT